MSEEVANKFLAAVAHFISPEARTSDRVYGLASGMVLGIRLSLRYPEYGVALLRECQEVLGASKQEEAFIDLLVEAVPLERVDGNGNRG